MSFHVHRYFQVVMESEGAAESAANEKTGASDDVTETKAEEAESETKENETAPENVEIQVDEKPANVNSLVYSFVTYFRAAHNL